MEMDGPSNYGGSQSVERMHMDGGEVTGYRQTVVHGVITEEAGASGVIKEEAGASKGYAHGRPQSY